MPPKKQKPIKSFESKNEEKNITIVDDVNKTDIDNTIDLDTEVEYDEVEFVKKTNYAEFDKNIKFNIYDQDNFQIETHKEIIIVADEKRKTSEIITKFEFTEVVSNRAKQIENGGKIFTDIGSLSNPIEMAELEIKMKKCPLSIRRMISSNLAEIWDVNEMIIPYY